MLANSTIFIGAGAFASVAGQLRFGPDVQWVPTTPLGAEDYAVDPALAFADDADAGSGDAAGLDPLVNRFDLGDDPISALIGLVLLGLDILMYRYLTAPGIVLTGDALHVNRFFRDQVIPYAEMAELSSYLERIHPPLINGTRMPPRIIHRLIVKTRDAEEIRMILPSFGSNVSVIDALEKRAGLPVARLPDVDKGR